jgi:hypothetical protein
MKTGFIIMSRLLSLASAAALAVTLSTPARAGEIFINGTTGLLTFTAAPGNTLEVSSTLGFQGDGSYDSGNPLSDTFHGPAVFGPVDFFTGPDVGPTPPGVFIPIPPANQTFSYQSTVGPADSPIPDSLTADISWTELDANAPAGEPQLFGAGVINTSSGDSTFLADFPMGGGINIFANFPLSGSCDLTQLAAGPPSCTVTFEVASFEGADAAPGLPPPPPPQIIVPEPMSSFMVLGVALCGLWGAYLMMRRERGRLGLRLLHETSV